MLSHASGAKRSIRLCGQRGRCAVIAEKGHEKQALGMQVFCPPKVERESNLAASLCRRHLEISALGSELTLISVSICFLETIKLDSKELFSEVSWKFFPDFGKEHEVSGRNLKRCLQPPPFFPARARPSRSDHCSLTWNQPPLVPALK